VAGETAPDVIGFPSPTLYFGLLAAARENAILHLIRSSNTTLCRRSRTNSRQLVGRNSFFR
jgi:hypothetical protein